MCTGITFKALSSLPADQSNSSNTLLDGFVADIHIPALERSAVCCADADPGAPDIKLDRS